MSEKKSEKSEAMMSAQEIAASQREAQLRELLGRPTEQILSDAAAKPVGVGAIINASPDFHYYVLDVTGLPADRAHVERVRVASAGYKPCSGPFATEGQGEISAFTPSAEVWRMPLATRRAQRQKRRVWFLSNFAHLRAIEFSRNPRFRDYPPEIQQLITADQAVRTHEEPRHA